MLRTVWLVAALVWPAVAMAQTDTAQTDIAQADYDGPTARYAHGILGDAIEWGSLRISLADGREVVVTLPDSHVFEDVAPRLVDIDNDGLQEVMVVETAIATGARLAIYGPDGQVKAATPHIGRTHRWLAPIGAADLDGDGMVEVAYIDRPHLAKRLLVWRYDGQELVPVAEAGGLTNHRIGEADIGGGLRICGGQIEMITASADWSRVIATRLVDGQLQSRDAGPHRGRSDLNAAMAC